MKSVRSGTKTKLRCHNIQIIQDVILSGSALATAGQCSSEYQRPFQTSGLLGTLFTRCERVTFNDTVSLGI